MDVNAVREDHDEISFKDKPSLVSNPHTAQHLHLTIQTRKQWKQKEIKYTSVHGRVPVNHAGTGSRYACGSERYWGYDRATQAS